MIQLLPGLRIKVPNRHSTYGRVKVKSIQLFLGKYSCHLKQCNGCVLNMASICEGCDKMTNVTSEKKSEGGFAISLYITNYIR